MGRFWTFAGVFRCVISLFCNKHGLNDLLFRVQIGNCIRIIVGFFVSLSSVKKKIKHLHSLNQHYLQDLSSYLNAQKIQLSYGIANTLRQFCLSYFTLHTLKILVGENQICNYFKDIKMMTFGCCLLNNKVHIPFT